MFLEERRLKDALIGMIVVACLATMIIFIAGFMIGQSTGSSMAHELESNFQKYNNFEMDPRTFEEEAN